MSNKQPTPGPWVNHDGIIRDSSPEGWLVATCRFNPKDEANAQLITAAPELLAALEQCLPIIDAYRRIALGDGDIAANNARAAIAKAKGDTQ